MAITEKNRKVLWGRSGNRCAICRTQLVQEKDPFNKHLNIGEECHIISKQTNGPRHKSVEGFDYDNSDNLLLLCCNDHKRIDELVEKFPEELLIQIKNEHEEWVTKNLDVKTPNETVRETERETENEYSISKKIIEFVTLKYDIEMNIKTSKDIFESSKGLDIAFSEIEKIKSKTEDIIKQINLSSPNYNIRTRNNKEHICDVIANKHTLLIQFYKAYSDSAKESYLLFGIIKGLFDENGIADLIYKPEIIEIIRLDFSYSDNGSFGWRNQENKDEFYESTKITELWIEKFFRFVLK
jgi:hypothetical protein